MSGNEITNIVSELSAPVLPIGEYINGDDDSNLDGNYLYFQNRALSEALLEGVFYIDTRQDGVLKQGAPLLKDKIVLANHHTDVSKWVGKVVDSRWSDSKVPYGIDTIVRMPKPGSEFSTDYNASIVKGLLSGDINSFSVGVRWSVSRSHPNMELEEFLSNQGKEIDGDIVRLIATKIKSFDEMSVVHQGRDPLAKLNGRVKIQRGTFGLDSDLSIDSEKDLKELIDKVYKNNSSKKFYVPEDKLSLDINLNINIIDKEDDKNGEKE